MSESEDVTIVYSGPALRRGMPVEMFCSSITAYEELLQETKRILDPMGQPLTVKVGRITTKGKDFSVRLHIEAEEG